MAQKTDNSGVLYLLAHKPVEPQRTWRAIRSCQSGQRICSPNWCWCSGGGPQRRRADMDRPPSLPLPHDGGWTTCLAYLAEVCAALERPGRSRKRRPPEGGLEFREETPKEGIYGREPAPQTVLPTALALPSMAYALSLSPRSDSRCVPAARVTDERVEGRIGNIESRYPAGMFRRL